MRRKKPRPIECAQSPVNRHFFKLEPQTCDKCKPFRCWRCVYCKKFRCDLKFVKGVNVI